MKTTLRLAKLELSNLFYSPIAWFLLIAFLFQCSLSYISRLAPLLIQQELGARYLKYLVFLTSKIFAPPFGIFVDITSNLYLYLPLLTMGLMSREVSSGTIKLLYSSPIRIREIVFGKFIAMMVYNLLLVLALGLVMIGVLCTIQHADIGFLLSGLLGIYLLLCAYTAIGLFMSCLTSYQVVAAVSTLVVLGALNYIGSLWQGVDFVRDLTYFLSMSGRVGEMLRGLISTRDVFYFLVIIFMFLGFSIYKLQGGRETSGWLMRAGRYVLIVVLGLVVGYCSNLPRLTAYYDATATKTNTLTPNSQRVIRELGETPLKVTSYINLLDNRYWYGSPEERNTDMERWAPYLRYKPGIQFKYVYYYDSADNKYLYKGYPGKTLRQIAENYAKSFGVDLGGIKSPEAIRKEVDLRPELNRYVMQLKYKDRTSFLRLYDDLWVFPHEAETSAALKRLVGGLPRIAFLEGELERSPDRVGDRDYKVVTSRVSFRYALINQGFDVDTLSLEGREIPAGLTALVIADPKMDFKPVVLDKLRRYIAEGGNLLIAGEPGKQSVLNPLLQPMGVQLMDGVLVQPGKDYAPDFILPSITDTAANFTSALKEQWGDSICVAMAGAAGLRYASNGVYDIQPLLMTDGRLSWNKKGKLTVDSGDVAYAAADGDERRAIPTALRLVRRVNGKEQRIVVTGDADFMDNAELERRTPVTANFFFNTALFSWLSDGAFPIDDTRPTSKDHHVTVTDQGMTAMRIVFLGLLPGVLLILGAVLLARRKRR